MTPVFALQGQGLMEPGGTRCLTPGESMPIPGCSGSLGGEFAPGEPGHEAGTFGKRGLIEVEA